MAVLRIDRFTAKPEHTDELLRRRNALVGAVRSAAPGLREARLVRVDDQTWIDMWLWDSSASAERAAERAQSGGIPEAAAAFELATDVTTEFTDVVDER